MLDKKSQKALEYMYLMGYKKAEQDIKSGKNSVSKEDHCKAVMSTVSELLTKGELFG